MTSQPLVAGIIAAGRGDRLRGNAHPPKPLVQVGRMALIDRVLGSIAEAEPSEVAIIINSDSTTVRDHVTSTPRPFRLRWIVETTPSSMHSFLRVVETLAAADHDGPFLISTVDTVAPPGAYADFVAAGRRRAGADVILAVADVEHDDTPLRVTVDGTRVTAIGRAAAGSALATAGYYLVRPSVLAEASAARENGLSALRLFLGRLLDTGYVIEAIRVPPCVDVDCPGDVDVAEQFVRRVDA